MVKKRIPLWTVRIATKEQFEVLRKADCIHRISSLQISSDLLFDSISDTSLGENLKRLQCMAPDIQWICVFPAIVRSSDYEELETLFSMIVNSTLPVKGILVGNLESLGFLKSHGYTGKIYADTGFYLWNPDALRLWQGTFFGASLPFELKAGEQHALIRNTKSLLFHPDADSERDTAETEESDYFWEKTIYARIPLMVTANCVAKTLHGCRKSVSRGNCEPMSLTDRKGIRFPVVTDCRHCLNIIYNSVPMSLHKEVAKWQDEATLRLQFTTENSMETEAILDFYLGAGVSGGTYGEIGSSFPLGEYTTGYEKRGVL